MRIVIIHASKHRLECAVINFECVIINLIKTPKNGRRIEIWRIRKCQHINDLHVYAFHAVLRCRIQAVPKNIVPSAPKNGIAKIDVNICEISEIQVNTYLLQMKLNGRGQIA